MKYSVISIEREYASGGHEIGERLAQRLGIPCYNKEILEKAAEKLGLPIKALTDLEERMTGSLLYSLATFANISSMVSGKESDFLTMEQRLAIAETDVIKDLTVSPCVIIGRGASALLKDNSNALKVFIHADCNDRKDRAVNIYNIGPNQAESVLQRYDKRRAAYFKATTNSDWKDTDIYHIFFNSGKLGIDGVVDVLYNLVI